MIFPALLIVYTKGDCMKTYFEWLEELIQELNYDTLIEEPWSVSFLNKDNVFQTMGNSRKNFYYVHSLDRTLAEFPVIREQLERAEIILNVSRIGRNVQGKCNLPEEYKCIFRVDFIFENQKEQAVFLDRDNAIRKKMSLKDAFEFMSIYKLPVSQFDHQSFIEQTEHILVDGTLLPLVSDNELLSQKI